MAYAKAERMGDMIVGVIDPESEGEMFTQVEFCGMGAGGGSPNTLAALRALLEAIEKDNRENPIAEV